MSCNSTSPLRRGLTTGAAVFLVLAVLNLLLGFFLPRHAVLYPVHWGLLAILAGVCSYFHARVEALTLRVAALDARLSKLEKQREQV